MSETAELKLSSEKVQVSPGEQVETSLTIRNSGSIVDVFSVDIKGLPETWPQLEATRVSLFPGDTTNVKLTITVPKKSDAISKTYDFTFNVSTDRNPSEVSQITGELEVLPYYDFKASISPQQTSGAIGEFTIALENGGNAEVGCFLEGNDPENLCQFSFDPSRSPAVAAGRKSEVSVIVEPGQRPWRRPSKYYNLTFSAKPKEESLAPTTLYATYEATPKLPFWAIPAAIVAAVVVVAIIVVAVLLTRGPSPIETAFLLNPGDGITVAFQLPESEPMRLELTADWEGGADSLDITLLRPDSSELDTIRVTQDDPKARFILDESEVGRGVIGWKIDLRNPNDAGQADGVLSMTRIGLN